MSQFTAIAPRPSAGDFARGQRNEPRLTHTDSDFATGMRLGRGPRITGNFATGMRTSNLQGAVGDFATGMRSVSIPSIEADPRVEENVQRAA